MRGLAKSGGNVIAAYYGIGRRAKCRNANFSLRAHGQSTDWSQTEVCVTQLRAIQQLALHSREWNSPLRRRKISISTALCAVTGGTAYCLSNSTRRNGNSFAYSIAISESR